MSIKLLRDLEWNLYSRFAIFARNLWNILATFQVTYEIFQYEI